MNVEALRQRLLAQERELVTRLKETDSAARESQDDTVRDAGDQSLSNERTEERFRRADLDRTTLKDVRAALSRMDAGTFGRCVVDGEPIEEKRLAATPWTPYCLKHQERREEASTLRPRTL